VHGQFDSKRDAKATGAAQHAGAYRLARVEPESIREVKKLDEVYAALSALPSRATND
jgi:hypothetical protein